MDFHMTIKTPNLYGDPTYDSDDSTDSELKTSSTSSSTSRNTNSSSSSPEPDFKVIIPMFSFLTINTWLLATWTFKPNPRYLRNLNLSKLRDAPAHIWSLPRGIRIRESIVAAREDFIKTLYTACSLESIATAADELSRRIGLWIQDLQTYAKTVPGVNCRSRKAAALMVRHRAANLTYVEALSKFGQFPSMKTLPAVRAALKELYVLKRIDIE